MKAKKRAMHLRKNAGKQSKVEEDDSNTYISAENDEAVAWTSDNDRWVKKMKAQSSIHYEPISPFLK